MKTFLVSVIFSLFLSVANAGISKVIIQASGLTCSMCSNAINKSLKSVSFVDKITANIKTSSFDITFKPNTRIDFDVLKKKVEDAGFFVAKFVATMSFDKVQVKNDEHILVDNTMFHFLDTKNKILTGEQKIQLLDKGFVPSKLYKKNTSLTKSACYKTGTMAACCTAPGSVKPSSSRVYHVMLA